MIIKLYSLHQHLKYLRYLEKLYEKKIKMDIINISNNSDIKDKLNKIFKDKKVNYHIVDYEDKINSSINSSEVELIP